MPAPGEARTTGWFSMQWGQRPLVTGNVGREHLYDGSEHWRHALAWARARARTDDVRMQFGGGIHVQLGPYEGSLLPRPEPATLGTVDTAAGAVVELLDQIDRLHRRLDEPPLVHAASPPRGRLRARLASADIPDRRRSLEISGLEPDRLAGIWGVALGRFIVGHHGNCCVLMRGHPAEGETRLRFSPIESGAPPSSGVTLELVVHDLGVVLRQLIDVGAVVQEERLGTAVVVDPEGNEMALTTRRDMS